MRADLQSNHGQDLKTLNSMQGENMSTTYMRLVLVALAVPLTVMAVHSSRATTQAARASMSQNTAAAVTDVTRLQPEAQTRIADMDARAVPVQESPNSPVYLHIDKAHAVVKPKVPAGDNGALLRTDLSAPSTILYVTYDCHGSTCPWTYQCEARTCAGHSIPFEYHGDKTAVWWGWTNDGNNSEYVFAIHYAAQ